MKGFLSVFKNSANELKSPVTLSVTGMLIALYIVLKIFATVYVTDNLRITFAFLALATIGMLYGPSVAFFAGAIGDVLGYFMAPTGGGYFVGYTLTYAIEGLIFGVMLYHKIHNSVDFKKINSALSFKSISRLAIARITVIIVCYILINSLNRYLMTGPAAFAWPALYARIIKNTLQLPIDIVIMSVMLPSIMTAYNRVFKKVY